MNINFSHIGFIPLQANIFFSVLIFFITGIAFQANNYSIKTILIILIIGLLISIAKKNLNTILKNSVLLLSSFFCGGYLYQIQQNKFENFRKLTNDKTFNITGTIKDIIKLEHSRFKKKIIFNVREIHEIKSGSVYKENILIQIYTNTYKNIQIDNTIKIENLFFKSFNNNTYIDHLTKDNIATSLFESKFTNQFISQKKFSFPRWINKIKNYIFLNIKLKTCQESFALFSSIFLGNTKNCSQKLMTEYRDFFQLWGLSHYLARAGLHMLIIIFLWSTLISSLKINFRLQQTILLMLIIIYYLLSWASIPFLRSLSMFLLYKTCIILNLQINSLHLLNVACFLMIAISPMQIFSLDFQLSFGLTYALIFLSISKQKNKISTNY